MERKCDIKDWRKCGLGGIGSGPLSGNCPTCTSLPFCGHVEHLSKHFTDKTNPGILTYARSQDFVARYIQPMLMRHGKRVGANAAAMCFYYYLNSIVYRQNRTDADRKKYGKVYASLEDIEKYGGFRPQQVKRYRWLLTGQAPGLEHVQLIRRVAMQFSDAGGYKEKVLWELLLYTCEREIVETVLRYREEVDYV